MLLFRVSSASMLLQNGGWGSSYPKEGKRKQRTNFLLKRRKGTMKTSTQEIFIASKHFMDSTTGIELESTYSAGRITRVNVGSKGVTKPKLCII